MGPRVAACAQVPRSGTLLPLLVRHMPCSPTAITQTLLCMVLVGMSRVEGVKGSFAAGNRASHILCLWGEIEWPPWQSLAFPVSPGISSAHLYPALDPPLQVLVLELEHVLLLDSLWRLRVPDIL